MMKPWSVPYCCLLLFRIGDWRVVADIQHEKITVLVVKVAHRSVVYG